MKLKEECGASCPRHAFTLVEMLLVLTILAMLAAIVYPHIVGRANQSRIDTTRIQIKSLAQTMQLFEVDNGYFPKGKNGFADLVQQPRDAKNWHGPYVEKIPVDAWGNAFAYECPGKHRPMSFDIVSMGPDGQAGTADDINNWSDAGPPANVTAR